MDEEFLTEMNEFCQNVVPYDKAKLQNGKFGQVCVIKHSLLDKLYVRKTIKRKHDFSIETMVHTLMHDNQYFVKMLYDFVLSKTHTLILEYIEDGDLFEWVKTNGAMNEAETRSVVRQLASALNSLHAHNIIHNDVKLENVLYTRHKRIKICDYGLCKIIDTESEQDGTLDYYSPEKIKMYNYEVSMDWWALGILTFELLSAHHPYKVGDDEILTINVLERRIGRRIQIISKASDKANNFLSHMLQPTYKYRLHRHSDIINHPFFNV